MKRQKSVTHTLSRLLLLAGLFLSLSLNAGIIYVNTNNVYGLNSATNFGKIDTTTGAYTNIANFSQALGSLAFNPAAGNFYVTEGNSTLATLRTLTDTGSLSSSTGTIGKTIYGMAYRTSDSTLYAYDFDADATGKINPSTGAWTTLKTSAGPTVNVPLGGRLALLNGSLYGAINNQGISGKFGTYGFDALTGFAQIGSNNNLFINMVLATDGTTLYGLYADGTAGNQKLYTINPSTGELTAGASISGSGLGTIFHGAAMETTQPPPLPEPPSLVLALTGLSAMWVARRRKHRV
jgi:hypothetical protein